MSELVGSGADVTAGIGCAREYGRGVGEVDPPVLPPNEAYQASEPNG